MRNVVVLADDESLVRMFLAEELSEQGYEVIEAATGEEALASLEKVQAACLVTDIEMGTPLDGIRLMQIANARWPSLAIVVMSGRRRAPELAHNTVFLAKPFKASELIDVIQGGAMCELPMSSTRRK